MKLFFEDPTMPKRQKTSYDFVGSAEEAECLRSAILTSEQQKKLAERVACLNNLVKTYEDAVLTSAELVEKQMRAFAGLKHTGAEIFKLLGDLKTEQGEACLAQLMQMAEFGDKGKKKKSGKRTKGGPTERYIDQFKETLM